MVPCLGRWGLTGFRFDFVHFSQQGDLTVHQTERERGRQEEINSRACIDTSYLRWADWVNLHFVLAKHVGILSDDWRQTTIQWDGEKESEGVRDKSGLQEEGGPHFHGSFRSASSPLTRTGCVASCFYLGPDCRQTCSVLQTQSSCRVGPVFILGSGHPNGISTTCPGLRFIGHVNSLK